MKHILKRMNEERMVFDKNGSPAGRSSISDKLLDEFLGAKRWRGIINFSIRRGSISEKPFGCGNSSMRFERFPTTNLRSLIERKYSSITYEERQNEKLFDNEFEFFVEDFFNSQTAIDVLLKLALVAQSKDIPSSLHDRLEADEENGIIRLQLSEANDLLTNNNTRDPNCFDGRCIFFNSKDYFGPGESRLTPPMGMSIDEWITTFLSNPIIKVSECDNGQQTKVFSIDERYRVLTLLNKLPKLNYGQQLPGYYLFLNECPNNALENSDYIKFAQSAFVFYFNELLKKYVSPFDAIRYDERSNSFQHTPLDNWALIITEVKRLVESGSLGLCVHCERPINNRSGQKAFCSNSCRTMSSRK